MADSAWTFDSEEDRLSFHQPFTRENCGSKLKLIRKILGMSGREFARVIGVSEATIRRLESEESLPTDEFIDRLRALCAIGAARFEKLAGAEREQFSELLGAGGGVAAGVGGSIGAISAAGAVGGLSAAGITSGVAAIGGGAMLAGVGVIAAIPVTTALLGYGLVKGLKAIIEANGLTSEEVSGRWEIRMPGAI